MKFKANLTATKVKKYLKKPTGCPFCESVNTNEAKQSLERSCDEATLFITCYTCRRSWFKIYTVTAVEGAQLCKLCCDVISPGTEAGLNADSEYCHTECLVDPLFNQEKAHGK